MTQVNNKRTQRLVEQLTAAALNNVEQRVATLKSKIRFVVDTNKNRIVPKELEETFDLIDQYVALRKERDELKDSVTIFAAKKNQKLDSIKLKMNVLRPQIRTVLDAYCEPSPYNFGMLEYATTKEEVESVKLEAIKGFEFAKIVRTMRFEYTDKQAFKAETLRMFYETLVLIPVENLEEDFVDTFIPELPALEAKYENVLPIEREFYFSYE